MSDSRPQPAPAPDDVPDAYLVIGRDTDVETEVQRSRFCTRLRRVEDEDAARELVARTRREHSAARHHCTAFIIGPHGRLQRSNDDGEPAGTAGAPMLDALTGRGVSDVVAVVTRYFGGVKLGTGGLVRAYGDAVSAALDAAGTRTRMRVEYRTATVTAADAGRLENELRADGLRITAVDYGVGPGGADAAITVAVPAAGSGALAGLIASRTGGRTEARLSGRGWVDRDE
ncbi:YigZ family protein [Tomitella fengzijianii]|uniref:YigZ family protein n=1 Tax=Tomitella fengzijianii TaxID=2597660 RepID=A0A516X445_9ACTN|nr:YigZ family protein [Tomitella fengzijianii]